MIIINYGFKGLNGGLNNGFAAKAADLGIGLICKICSYSKPQI